MGKSVKPFAVDILDAASLRKIAGIMGASSAAARALAEFDRRVSAGEDLVLVLPAGHHTILIVPKADLTSEARP